MNAARKSGANIVYYVAHVDYIQYISGLKPIREGVILVCLTATTAAGELRAYATIVGMGITYLRQLCLRRLAVWLLVQPLRYVP